LMHCCLQFKGLYGPVLHALSTTGRLSVFRAGESLRRRGLPASRNRRILSHRARYARTTPWLAPLGFGQIRQPPPVRRRVGAVRAPCRGPAGGFARRPDEPSPAAAPVHRGDRHPAGHWLWITSACTGALLLHEAGVARGRRVATHHASEDTLEARGNVTVVRDARYVVDGNVVTSQGVSTGIDMALRVTGQSYGRGHARAVSRYIQHDPAPPYLADEPVPTARASRAMKAEPHRNRRGSPGATAAAREAGARQADAHPGPARRSRRARVRAAACRCPVPALSPALTGRSASRPRPRHRLRPRLSR